MSAPVNIRLFVYGSLRSGFHSPVYDYIRRYFDFIGEGRVKGKIFDMGDYAAAVPVKKKHISLVNYTRLKTPENFLTLSASSTIMKASGVNPASLNSSVGI